MKIYFGASLLYLNERRKVYQEIKNAIESLGHESVGFDVLSNTAKDVMEMSDESRVESYKKFLGWMNKCDQAVIEASFPSTLHIGHEITLALEKGKPVIALYQKGSKPFFLAGVVSDKLSLIEYTNEKDIGDKLERKIKENTEVMDIRFNFFISPEIGRYLDWVSKHKKIPRAAFLRSLIEKTMKAEKDFEKK